MHTVRLANEKDYNFFYKDYIKNCGNDDDLAKKHANASIYINRSIVIEIDSQIIGSITWAIRDGINSGLVEIFQMSILNEFRGQGYGNILLENCLEDVSEFYKSKNTSIRKIFILILESNIIGRNLYRNHDFKMEHALVNLRRTNERDLLYVREFKEEKA